MELIAMPAESLTVPSGTNCSEAAKSKFRAPLLHRVYDAVLAGQNRRAEREIARYLRGRGGKFTDGLEREIERYFLNGKLR
jgi:hypothetical protein